MRFTGRLLTMGILVTLTGLAGCVWDPAMRGENRYNRDRDYDRQGSYSQHDYRDRNGQPCERQGHDSDEHHNDDCRTYRP